MRCKCGGCIIVSQNTKPASCGFCLECCRWYEHDDLMVIQENERMIEEHKKVI